MGKNKQPKTSFLVLKCHDIYLEDYAKGNSKKIDVNNLLFERCNKRSPQHPQARW